MGRRRQAGKGKGKKPMAYSDAASFALPFGKFRGKEIDAIAASDDGLLYLDWLVGTDLYGNVKQALETYLGDPSIQGEVRKAKERRQ